MKLKIIIVTNRAFPTWRNRRFLISALVARGIEVTLLTPDGPEVPKLKGLGANHVVIPLHRFTSPLRDLKLSLQLYRTFRSEKPDIVHTVTVKPNTYGALAAWLAGVPKIVALATGLGYGFSEDGGWKQAILRVIVKRLYWLAGKVINRMCFQNPDDLSQFVESGLLSQDKAVLIRSSGIDLREYSPESVDRRTIAELRAELGIDGSTRVVLMTVSRVVWSKGVKTFVEASQRAAGWRTKVKFVLAGPILADGSPDPVPEEYLQSTSHFTWLGNRSDIRELLGLSDVVALTSILREGVPRSLLEGLAMKKPIVTTDEIGCRETVDHAKNGFLVPVGDTEAFASAVKKLIDDTALRASFGRHSLIKARAEFDVEIVVKRYITELYGLDGQDLSK